MTMVLIDDDEDDLEVLQAAIRGIMPEAKCDVFRDSDKGLCTMIKDEMRPPDFIFIDINMPRMTGDICLKKLRSTSKFDSTKIVIISTSVSESFGKELLKNGATFVFSKPMKMDGYNNILQQCFDVNVELTGR